MSAKGLERYTPLFERDSLSILVNKLNIEQKTAELIVELSDKFSIFLGKWFIDHAREMRYETDYDYDPPMPPYYFIGSDHRYLSEITDWLKGRNNRPNPKEPRNLDLGKINYKEAQQYAKDWHESLGESEETRKSKVQSEQERSLIVFPDGWYWLDIQTNSDDEEAEFMGHCGRDDGADTLISLRDPENGHPHITVSLSDPNEMEEIGIKDGIEYRQCKGVKNSKPKQEYHEKIVDLFKKLKIRYKSSEGYKPQNDFTPYDLDKEKYKKFLSWWFRGKDKLNLDKMSDKQIEKYISQNKRNFNEQQTAEFAMLISAGKIFRVDDMNLGRSFSENLEMDSIGAFEVDDVWYISAGNKEWVLSVERKYDDVKERKSDAYHEADRLIDLVGSEELDYLWSQNRMELDMSSVMDEYKDNPKVLRIIQKIRSEIDKYESAVNEEENIW